MDQLLAWDQKLLLLINSWNQPVIDSLMQFFSGQIIWLPFLFIFFGLAYRTFSKNKFYLFFLFLSLALVASDVTSSYILKNIFTRLRPCRVSEIKELMYYFGQRCGGKYGFVSSHAANSICLVLFSFLSMPIQLKKFKWIWFLPFIVSYSRIYLGAHYPGDILGGLVVGTIWAYLLAKIFNSTSLGSKA
jgi:undecaprenyl-diphosphatase